MIHGNQTFKPLQIQPSPAFSSAAVDDNVGRLAMSPEKSRSLLQKSHSHAWPDNKVMDFSIWLPFFAAAWAISFSPGAGAVAAMGAGLSHGFRRGYVMTYGLVLGIWTQLLVVGIGLGALIAASSTAFAIVKWVGVAYLIWLGIKQFRAPVADTPSEDTAPTAPAGLLATGKQLFLRGWMVNSFNPKGTVFLLAVVPQFLDLTRALPLQYLVIGATLGFTDLVVMAGYTALAARVLGLMRSPKQLKALNRIFGSLFVGAGILLSLFKRS